MEVCTRGVELPLLYTGYIYILWLTNISINYYYCVAMAEVVKYAANLPLDKTPNQMVGEHGCAATISVQVCE